MKQYWWRTIILMGCFLQQFGLMGQVRPPSAAFLEVESQVARHLANNEYEAVERDVEQLKTLAESGNEVTMRIAYWEGALAHEKKDFERASHLLQKAEKMARDLNKRYYWGNALWRIGSILEKRQEDKSEAQEKFKTAIDLLQKEKDTLGLCASWYELGGFLLENGREAEGKQAMETASQLAKKAKLRSSEVTILSYWGYYHFNRGNYAEGLPPALESMKAYEEMGKMEDLARCQNMVGAGLNRMGQAEKSIEYLDAALKTAREHGFRAIEASALINKGVVLQEGGKLDEALEYLLDAYEIFRRLNDKPREAACLNNIAFNYEQQGDFAQAIKYQEKALLIDRSSQDPIGEAISLCNLGEYNRQIGKHQIAIASYLESIQICDSIGSIGIESYYYNGLAESYKATGEYALALLYKEKLDSLQKLENPAGEDSALSQVWKYEEAQHAEKFSKLEDRYNGLFWLAVVAGLLVLTAMSGWLIMIIWKRRLGAELKQLDQEMEAKDKELGQLQAAVSNLGQELERQKQLLDLVKKESGEDVEVSQEAFLVKLRSKRHWSTFLAEFEMHNPVWLQELRLRHPDLSSTDIRLLALAKMGLSTTESAEFLSITVAGVKKARQRIRKKLGLETEESIDQFLNSL